MTTSAPIRPPPPKLSPKPGHVKVVRALYQYTAQYDTDLSFDEGDILYITDMSSDDGWWKAKCGPNTGLIPSNYVEESTESIDNPLHEACKRGNTTFLKECLDNKVSVNSLDKAGCVALHWASRGGHIDCVKLLLEINNVQVNVQNKLGDTPLHSAAWKGHSKIASLLLEKGSGANMLNNDKKSPLDLCHDPETCVVLRAKSSNGNQRLSGPYNVEDYGGNESDSD